MVFIELYLYYPYKVVAISLPQERLLRMLFEQHESLLVNCSLLVNVHVVESVNGSEQEEE